MTSSMIYWFTRLDGVVGFCTAITATAGIITLFCFVVWICTFDDVHNGEAIRKVCKRIFKVFIPIFILFWLCCLLIPTSKEMAGIYLLPKIANNENVKAIPNKSMEIVNLKLDEWIKDMRDNK